MSETNGKKPKSGIPVVKKNDNKVVDNNLLEPLKDTKKSNEPSSVEPVKSNFESLQPLAKLKNPIDKHTLTFNSKTVAKFNRGTKTNSINGHEIWQDEKTESVSQSLQAKTFSEREKRREDMENQIKLLEEELKKMGGLLEERKKLMEEAQDEMKKQHDSMEKLIVDQQSLLVQNGIDPVTGETIVAETGQQVETQPKFSKKKIQEMREKLRNMNEKTSASLIDMEKTLLDIDNLEKVSERARSHSPETVKMLQQLSESDDLHLQEDISSFSTQPPGDIDLGNLDDYVQEKFGLQFFLTENNAMEGSENDVA